MEPLISIPVDFRAFKFEYILNRMIYNPDNFKSDKFFESLNGFEEPCAIDEKPLHIRIEKIIYELEHLMKETD